MALFGLVESVLFLEVMLPAGSQDLCGTCSLDEGRTWLDKAKRSNKFALAETEQTIAD